MSITHVRKAENVDDPILLAAARMEPKLRSAFLSAVEAARGSVDMAKLTDAIARRNAGQVMAVLQIDKKFADAMKGVGIKAAQSSVRDALQQTFAAGAKAAIGELPNKVSVGMSFNQMSPEAVRFLESYEARLIQQISGETRDAIQQALVRAFKEGISPAVQAREIRSVIGLTANQERAVENYRDALESGSRSALDRALRDGRTDSKVLRAIEDSEPLDPAYVDKLVSRYRDRYVSYRANNIARSESVRAANAGQHEAWKQAKAQGLLSEGVKRQWVSAGDSAECDECADLDGEEAGLDEEFAPGIMHPPDPHSSCRCSTVLVFPSGREEEDEAA